MSFADAVRSALSKYATFSGRARRSEYWWFAVFNMIAIAIPYALLFTGDQNMAQIGMILYVAVALGLLLPGLAVSVRRLHDTNRSGWWYLLNLVPLGFIALLVFFAQDSQPTRNGYGPSPKHEPVVEGDAAVAPAV